MSAGKIQTLPTTIITGYWDPGSVSDVPENIKVVMANKKRAVYRLVVEQPRPQLKDTLDKFSEICVGYERKVEK